MSTQDRKLRKRLGVPFLRVPKEATPVVNRAGTWRYGATKSTAGKIRPTKLGILFGIRDLGWQPVKDYLTDKNTLNKKAAA